MLQDVPEFLVHQTAWRQGCLPRESLLQESNRDIFLPLLSFDDLVPDQLKRGETRQSISKTQQNQQAI